MPWQAIVTITLLIFLLPFLLLRLIPWLIARALQLIFLLAYGTVFTLFWLFYQIETLSQKIGNGNVDFLQGIDQFIRELLKLLEKIRELLKLLEKIKEVCQKIEKRAFQYKWILGKKSLYLLPLIILPFWFLRPWLKFAPELSSLIDKTRIPY
jgi:hypothetical protein